MPILCYDCNRQSKRKLEEENQTKRFFMYVLQVYLMKNKKSKKIESMFYYACVV